MHDVLRVVNVNELCQFPEVHPKDDGSVETGVDGCAVKGGIKRGVEEMGAL